jgi:hypothetical protein
MLQVVKIIHTVIWAFFAGCILAIPILGWFGMYGYGALLTGIVLAEILIVILNGWRCPLTGVAAHYTDDRRDNFDIYLPLWLARYNKEIFGSLFVAGVIFTVFRWFGW